MSRMMWVPSAVHRYYLQEVKRRSSVMRPRPINPSMPDSNLVITYKDLIGKDSDELMALIDPNFEQLARVEQLNKTLTTTEQLDTEIRIKTEVTDKEEATENIVKDLEHTGIAVIPFDATAHASFQFPNEIETEVTINTNAEIPGAQSSKIMTVQTEEEINETFEMLDEIIAQDMQDDAEEVAKKKLESNRDQRSYIIDGTPGNSNGYNEFAIDFELSEQYVQELMQQEAIQEHLKQQEIIVQVPMNKVVVVVEPVPDSAPIAPPKQIIRQPINMRTQKHVITEQAIENREIEVAYDNVSHRILVDMRPSICLKIRRIKTYERKRKEDQPYTDSRPDKKKSEEQ